MALAKPHALTELILAPAQRADLIVDIISPVGFDMVTRQGPYRLADLAVSGTNTDRKTGPIPALALPNLPLPDEPTQHLTLTMMGGAMGGGTREITSGRSTIFQTYNPSHSGHLRLERQFGLHLQMILLFLTASICMATTSIKSMRKVSWATCATQHWSMLVRAET